ncbi:MAG TPA: K(+)-transporting ATPase subunit C [Saprospiraceae bacterium]|nr:K(+)-transporting ATPase subunit C [Saprospiraceae bacterium]
MQTYILPSLKMTALLLVLCSGIYTAIVWGVAQATPNQGKGFVIEQNGKTYYANIGQAFDDDRYFWSRPSAVGYNAAGSAGSNKGPSNADYLAQVQARIDTFLVHNPGVAKSQIPADMVTASGSGLDPHISPQGARIQAARVARVRNLPEARVRELVEQHVEGPWLGMFGPSRVNVLKLNLALDNLK